MPESCLAYRQTPELSAYALRAKRGSGGAQRGSRAVAPAWAAGIEGERVSRGAEVGPENTDCQRFGGPSAAIARQIRPRPAPLGLHSSRISRTCPSKSR